MSGMFQVSKLWQPCFPKTLPTHPFPVLYVLGGQLRGWRDHRVGHHQFRRPAVARAAGGHRRRHHRHQVQDVQHLQQQRHYRPHVLRRRRQRGDRRRGLLPGRLRRPAGDQARRLLRDRGDHLLGIRLRGSQQPRGLCGRSK